MRNLIAVTLISVVSVLGQEHGATQTPSGDATGHAQAPMQDSAGPGQEHAQLAAKHGEGHEESPMPNEIWWKWANFAVLAAGLGYLASKNAGPFFRTRSEEIRKGIDEAAKVRADAEARAAEIERKVGNLSADVGTLQAKLSTEIAAEGARVQAETEAQVAKIRAQAEREIASAAKQASLQLKAYSAQLALNLAEQRIRQQLDGRTQDGLVDAFVKDLRESKAEQATTGVVQ